LRPGKDFFARGFYLMRFCRTQDFRNTESRDSTAKPPAIARREGFKETQSASPKVTLFR
jgi:hypothetical protein